MFRIFHWFLYFLSVLLPLTLIIRAYRYESVSFIMPSPSTGTASSHGKQLLTIKDICLTQFDREAERISTNHLKPYDEGSGAMRLAAHLTGTHSVIKMLNTQ